VNLAKFYPPAIIVSGRGLGSGVGEEKREVEESKGIGASLC
jgi:hypothetical protein